MEEISFKQWLYHIMFTIITPIIWLVCLVVFILPLGIVAPMLDVKLKKEKRYLYFLPTLVFTIRQYADKKHRGLKVLKEYIEITKNADAYND